MSHLLVAGQIQSGKTTLARRLAEIHRRRGWLVLVYDPIGQAWPTEYVYHDPDELLRAAKLSRSCFIVVDEADTVVGQSDRHRWWLALRSRHYGHSCTFVTQRPAMVAPSVRHQCLRIACFSVDPDDALELRRTFNEPALYQAPALKQGRCIIATRFGGVRFMDVFAGRLCAREEALTVERNESRAPGRGTAGERRARNDPAGPEAAQGGA